MADMVLPARSSRAASVSSAGTTSTTGALSFIPRFTPRPEPGYISARSAADHITHRHNHEHYELLSPTASPTDDGAVFSESSLALLNLFLDSLLYNFLAKARGTSLKQLRPAIVEVLKAKLGREALASADEELQGLVSEAETEIDNGDDYAIPEFARQRSGSQSWHLESAFKRMRLRVMVFIRLGDFDDEDEEKFLEEDADEPMAQDLSFLSTPAAVYLASVLEYLAEQTLTLAGDAAYTRTKSKARRTISEDQPLDMDDSESVIVEDSDVEKIALNSSLGRLWRIWRKNSRGVMSPTSPGRRTPRRGSIGSPHRRSTDESIYNGMRHASIVGGMDEAREMTLHEIPEGEPSETDIAANIPLPMADNDVNEIEVPGLAKVIYDDGEEIPDDIEETDEPRWRPRSAVFNLPGSWFDEYDDVEAQKKPMAETEAEIVSAESNQESQIKENHLAEEEDSEKAVVADVETVADDEKVAEQAEEKEVNANAKEETEKDEAKQMEQNAAKPVVRFPLKRQRSNSVPSLILSPWHRWSEAFLKRLDDETYIAARFPLPSTDNDVDEIEGREVPADSSAIEEDSIVDKIAEKVTAQSDTAEGPGSITELKDESEKDLADTTPAAEKPEVAKEDEHHSAGLVVGAIAGAAAMMGAAYNVFSHTKKDDTPDEDLASQEALSVQTKEPYEPEEMPEEPVNDVHQPIPKQAGRSDTPLRMSATSGPLDDNAVHAPAPGALFVRKGKVANSIVRRSVETPKPAPESVYEGTGSNVVEPVVKSVASPKDKRTSGSSVRTIPDGTSAEPRRIGGSTTGLDVHASSVKTSAESRQEQPSSKVIEPPVLSPKDSVVESKRSSVEDHSDEHVFNDISESDASNLKDPSKEKPTGLANGIAQSAIDSKQINKAIPASEVKTYKAYTPDSKSSTRDAPAVSEADDSMPKPVGLLKEVAPVVTAASKPTAPNGISPTVSAVKASDSPVSPVDGDVEEQMQPPPPRISSKDVPVRPNVVEEYDPYNGNHDAEAIGVARTSNVPIHSPSPPPSSDQRPWTPNRGTVVRSVSRSPDRNTSIHNSSDSFRNRVGPSPLRSVSSEAAGQENASRDFQRTVVSIVKRHDLDIPASMQPMESPVIPKFHGQPLQTDQTRPASATRSSSGGRATPTRHSPKGSQGSTGAASKNSLDKRSEVDKQREFDALLAGKETVKYTLTPEEIRDVGAYSAKSSIDRKIPAAIDTTRTAPITSPRSPTLVRRSPPQAPPSPKGPLRISDIRKSIAALSPEPVEPKTRKNAKMARDARVMGGDTKDFVDFVRSTGPASEPQVVPLVLSNHKGSMTGTRQGLRSSLTPREADVRSGTSDDLLDFLRQGPPGAGAGEDRIPKRTAPFRSTMDSDELRGLSNGRVPSTTASVHNSSVVSRPSGTNSINSTSRLIQEKALPAKPRGPSNSLNAPHPQVTRKQRRVKDPYAIDSDDEDDFATALPVQRDLGGSFGGTENLQEFLRSTGPARGNGPAPLSNGVRRQAGSTTTQPPSSQTPVNGAPTAQRARSNTGGSLTGVPAPPQSRSATGSLPNRNSHPALASGLKSRLEARPAGATRSGFGGRGYHYSTNDMVDFLRTSAPPRKTPNGIGAPSPDIPLTKKSSGRGRKFWQRKEVGVYD